MAYYHTPRLGLRLLHKLWSGFGCDRAMPLRGALRGALLQSTAFALLAAATAVAGENLLRSDFLATPAASAFREGRFSDATSEFERLLQKYPDDPNVLLNLASSLRRQGKLRDAEKVLLKVKEIAPNAPAIYYYLGLIYYKIGDTDRAIEAYNKTIELSPDSIEAQDARQLLAAIGLKQSQSQPVNPDRPWNAYAQVGIEYDNNVKAATGSEKDGAFRLTQYAQGDYRLLRRGPLSVNVGGWAYHGSNLDSSVDNLDLTALSPTINASYATTVGEIAVLPGLEYRYEVDWLQDDYYGQRHEIRPYLTLSPSPWLETSVYYAAQFEKFDDKGPVSSITSRNAFTNLEGLRQYFFFNGRQSYLTTAAEFKQSNAQGRNFNYDLYAGELGVSFLLTYELRFGLTGRYEYEDHSDFQPPEDLTIKRQIYTASLTRNITEHLAASLYYSYRDDDASIGVFNYTRNIGGIYLGYTF